MTGSIVYIGNHRYLCVWEAGERLGLVNKYGKVFQVTKYVVTKEAEHVVNMDDLDS